MFQDGAVRYGRDGWSGRTVRLATVGEYSGYAVGAGRGAEEIPERVHLSPHPGSRIRAAAPAAPLCQNR